MSSDSSPHEPHISAGLLAGATVAITGGSGFLGSYLSHYLAARGLYSLRMISRSAHDRGTGTGQRIQWLQGDLNSRADCERFIEGADIIIHLAHTNTPLSSHRDLPADANLNLIPTLNLIEAIRHAKRRPHVVFASSGGAVYGPTAAGVLLKEDTPCAPISSYGIQKLCAEHYLRVAAHEGWLTAVTTRIANPYGALLPSERKQGFIGVVAQRIKERTPVDLFSASSTVRDYIHLDDMCRGVEAAFAHTEGFDIINIGSGVGHSLEQVLGIMESVSGPIQRRVISAAGAGSLPDWNVLDITKAKEVLGWSPEISLESGLHSFLNTVL